MKVFSIIGMVMSVIAIISGIVIMSDKSIWQGYGLIVLVLGLFAICYFGIKLCESIKINKLYASKKQHESKMKNNSAGNDDYSENGGWLTH